MILCNSLYIPILSWFLRFSFVTGLAEKLYKILHAHSVVFSKMLVVPHAYQANILKYPQNENFIILQLFMKI
ncbi:hypothetical protein CN931_08830 [Bacillus sp. AFS054943]|uniref:Uncharacterized protein n=1 Tax=Bacillus cereus TaxID=1396 RepID=A0A2C1LXC6_BACCE|nr:hypothetical protein CN476_02195 [Bacillus cereus]PGL85512.1 hypothetical protein CN931_08830 [Bacillus sp. AFS054943]PGU02884.1 hypothetical protein COD19_11270 [Bacillus cereus]PGX11358.1 hypothetical protein COE07_12445 [Bacillus sp. AFS033286]PGZ74694.1 hypothetical protein COE49_08470 [Bacillus sp. AFS029637]